MLSDLDVTAVPALSARPDSGPPRWIGEDDVVGLVSLPQAIDAIRSAYLRVAAGEIVAMPKTYASWDGGTLHAIRAVASSTGLAVSKTWAHTGGGATPILAAWEGGYRPIARRHPGVRIGQFRTSAISGTATSILAAES